MARLVIVGGVAAGMSAAARAHRVDPSLEISVLERSGYVSYGACGFPYFIKGEIADIHDLLARTPQSLREEGISAFINHTVTRLDPPRNRVEVTCTTTGACFTHPYDRLILATGSDGVKPALPGGRLSGIFTLYSVEDALAIRAWIENVRPQQAVIIGGGNIGLEMAEALAAHCNAVTVVELGAQVLGGLDAEMAAKVQAELAAHGVGLRLGVQARSFIGERLVGDLTRRVAAALRTEPTQQNIAPLRVREVVLDNESLPAEIVIWGVGSRPNVALAAAAGICLGPSGAIAVDAGQQTNLPGIYAAGAASEVYHRVLGRPIYLPKATVASKQGRVAGTNAAGGAARYAGMVGTSSVKVFDLQAAHTGLSLTQALRQGLDAAAVSITAQMRAAYLPGGAPVHARLVFERTTRRLLGAQLVGGDHAARGINIAAAALQAEWTLTDLQDLDLAYSPPIAPLWDALVVAANVAARS